jgi:single-strand DNA-binding protein
VIVFGRLEQRSFETQDGEKRTVVEVVADSIGPDLRWATAEVTKTERTGGGGRGKAPSGDRAPDPIYGDEEPF